MSSPEAVQLGSALAVALLVSACLSPVLRSIARRAGFVARPAEDRWHREPTALLGGPAIVLGAIGALLVTTGLPDAPALRAWLAGGLLIALVGLLDDLRSLKPATKLIAQIVAALIPIQAGVGLPQLHPLVSFWVTLLWIVGITNAVNLLDNMDGLAAGIAAIASAFLCAHALRGGATPVALATVAVCGAAIGFLFFNFQPASIFMGDAGSLFLGFSLGTLSLQDLRTRPLVSLSIISIPALLLAIPVFDTALVTVLRLVNGRSPAQGGRDHSSHRLVSLGLSERRAVFLLWGLSATAGALSLVVPHLRASVVTLLVLSVLLVVYYFGAYLGTVNVYRSDPAAIEHARSRGLFVFDTFLAYKQRIVDVAVDVVTIILSYLLAHLLRYDGVLSSPHLALLFQSLPYLLGLRLLCAFAFGLYRSVPGSFSIHDLLAVAKSVLLSSVLLVTGLVFLDRLQDYSRTVIVIDAIVAIAGLSFSRIALRSLGEIVQGIAGASGRRVLVVGAGAFGEAAVRLLKSDPATPYRIVGFLDDSPDRIGRSLHGIPVLGALSDAERILQEQEVDVAVLAVTGLNPMTRTSLEETCRHLEVEKREILLR